MGITNCDKIFKCIVLSLFFHINRPEFIPSGQGKNIANTALGNSLFSALSYRSYKATKRTSLRDYIQCHKSKKRTLQYTRFRGLEGVPPVEHHITLVRESFYLV